MWYVLMAGWMLLLAALWLAVIAAFAGIGHLVWRAGGRRLAWRGTWHDAVWTGVVATVFSLQIWHLFAAVDGRALGLWLMAAAAGWLVRDRRPLGFRRRLDGDVPLGQWRRYAAPVWEAVRQEHVLAWLFFGWFVFRIANDGIAYTPVADDYHFTGLNWIASMAIVPGLGNLEGRLAFNNSSLLLHSLVDIPVGPQRMWGVLHGAWALTLASASLRDLFRILRRPARASIIRLGRALVLIPLVLISVRHRQMYGLNGI